MAAKTRHRTALVLSGGGSRGAYQLGVYQGLQEAGFVPDLIVGTSVGAINGAFIAAGCSPARMRRLWLELGTRNFAPRRRDYWRFRRWDALASASRLRGVLHEHLDLAALRSSPIQLRVTAVGTCCGEYAVFGNKEVTVDHLLASSAVPGIFPPVRIEDHYFVDGAVMQRTPLRPAIEEGADEIYVILNDPISHCAPGHPGSLPDLMVRVLDIQARNTLLREVQRAEEINAMLRRGLRWKGWRPLRIHIVAPRSVVEGSVFSLAQERTRRLLAAGVRDGRRFAAERWGRHAPASQAAA